LKKLNKTKYLRLKRFWIIRFLLFKSLGPRLVRLWSIEAPAEIRLWGVRIYPEPVEAIYPVSVEVIYPEPVEVIYPEPVEVIYPEPVEGSCYPPDWEGLNVYWFISI
jgi:hypothetical protein